MISSLCSLPRELRKRREEMSNPKKVTASSGNVFADLGFDNPEEELLKAKLVREIRGIIKRRKLTQAKAAAVLGLKQPDVSALSTGRVHKVSLERLLRCVRRPWCGQRKSEDRCPHVGHALRPDELNSNRRLDRSRARR